MTEIGVVGKSRENIHSLVDVVEILADHRAKDKTIVHCHGVFDLLHIGHIRHFEEAKALGDILIVTVTPDRFVNKGPGRPAFGELLRAETIAALDCVDYVAINKWPTAVKAVKLTKPHYFVKGSEYADMSKDRTGGITEEEEAINSVGGKLVFTNDITFSSSSLINKHLSVLPSEVSQYLAEFSGRHGAEEIVGYLESAKPLKVLLVGESIIDEYQYCRAIGKSSKEPILAVKHLSTEKFAGGILAVCNNVARFSDNVGLVSFLGERDSQEEFVRRSVDDKVDMTFLYRKDSPTIVKRRFIESYFFTKMIEVYEMNDGVLDNNDNDLLCATLNEQMDNFDVVIVVDFGNGMLSEKAIKVLTDQARFLAVNAQSNAGNLGYHTISRYPRADFISMSEGELRLEARDRAGNLENMIADVSRKLSCDKIVVTKGSGGNVCYSVDEGFFEVPAFAGQVVDRMGAGDASFSLTALCVAQNVPMEVVGFIGNTAGAMAVATVGHREALERVPLFRYIDTVLK